MLTKQRPPESVAMTDPHLSLLGVRVSVCACVRDVRCVRVSGGVCVFEVVCWLVGGWVVSWCLWCVWLCCVMCFV